MRVRAIIAAGFALLASRELPAQGRVEAGHRHSLSLFVGAASSSERHETAIAVGPTYSYLLSQRIALGAVLEVTSYRTETSTLVLGGLFLRPHRGIELTVAPGVEWITGTADTSQSTIERGELAVRFGVGYQLRMRRAYVMSPEAAVNLGSGAATAMYGLTFRMFF